MMTSFLRLKSLMFCAIAVPFVWNLTWRTCVSGDKDDGQSDAGVARPCSLQPGPLDTVVLDIRPIREYDDSGAGHLGKVSRPPRTRIRHLSLPSVAFRGFGLCLSACWRPAHLAGWSWPKPGNIASLADDSSDVACFVVGVLGSANSEKFPRRPCPSHRSLLLEGFRGMCGRR